MPRSTFCLALLSAVTVSFGAENNGGERNPDGTAENTDLNNVDERAHYMSHHNIQQTPSPMHQNLENQMLRDELFKTRSELAELKEQNSADESEWVILPNVRNFDHNRMNPNSYRIDGSNLIREEGTDKIFHGIVAITGPITSGVHWIGFELVHQSGMGDLMVGLLPASYFTDPFSFRDGMFYDISHRKVHDHGSLVSEDVGTPKDKAIQGDVIAMRAEINEERSSGKIGFFRNGFLLIERDLTHLLNHTELLFVVSMGMFDEIRLIQNGFI